MLVEMDIKTVVIGGGPVSSLIVLMPSKQDEKEPLSLPIRIGSVEATAISMGVNPVFAIVAGLACGGFGILPGFIAGYAIGFIAPLLERLLSRDAASTGS